MSSRLYLRSSILNLVTRDRLRYEFKGLRMSFKVEKTTDSAANTMSCEIYNLSSRSRAHFEAVGNLVALEAGYDGNTSGIFLGDVTNVIPEKRGPDVILKIEAGDGDQALQGARIEKSFPAGTPALSLIEAIKESFKDLGALIKPGALPITDTVKTGIVLSGNSKDVMDQLARTYDLDWSIQDGEFVVKQKGQPGELSAVLLSSTTGLLGGPTKKDDSFIIRSLLNPEIKPGKLVVLESRFITGTFLCDKVTHSGDNMSGAWETNIEATRLGDVPKTYFGGDPLKLDGAIPA